MANNEKLTTAPELITQNNENNSITVNLQGGKIPSLVLSGSEIFWSGVRPDGSQAATHVSAPWFGPYRANLPHENSDLGYHGPARKSHWEKFFIDKKTNQLTLQIQGLENIYPNLRLLQTTSIQSGTFIHLLTAINNSDFAQKNYNPGFHWYLLNKGKLNDIIINGKSYAAEDWENATIISARKINEVIMPNFAIFEIDTNLPNFAIWSQANKDNYNSIKHSFACIEPTNDPENITKAKPIMPGNVVHHHATLRLVKSLL